MSDARGKNNKGPDEEEGIPTASFPGSGKKALGQVGPYKLLSVLGEGGCGMVYLAERERPVKRRVALKVIKPGMDSKQVIARFEAEEQALALLDHPNVAQVYEAGMTETGQSYFAMEYVKGVPITEHCDRQKLSVKERLKLFLQICDAVGHAHQKGIIHRDIKPSNILVLFERQKALPKVIDFGIAKAISQPLTDRTLFTEQGQLLGTPEYMSPEQAEMTAQDIDTRSDIYSLGVVLYELLTGTLPFDRKTLERAGFGEIQRIIREQDPPRPSTRLSSLGEEATKIAQSRRTEVSTLTKQLHKELEWIPLKAMRKERTRRYRSASELADDIQNYLKGAPLIAGPESAVYRAKKFVRRNRALVTGIAAVLVVLIAGIVVSTIFAIGQSRARAQADKARSVAEEARTAEAEQRKLAETKAEDLRRSLYVNSINLADSKYKEGNIARVRELLDSCPEDLRGWEWYRLNYVSDQPLMTLHGHRDNVYSVVLDPDGKRIISGSQDETVKVWDAETGAELRTLEGHKSTVWSVAFNQHTQRIVSGGDDIKVWDAATGAEVMTLRGHKGVVLSVAFSPDGKYIISGSENGTIKVWDVATGTQKMALRAHDDGVGSVSVSPDGKCIVSSGGSDNMIKVWDAATGKELMTLCGHRHMVVSVAFSHDGKKIVSGGSDKTIKIWDATTGTELKTLHGHERGVYSVVLSSDGKRIVSGSGDNTIKIWDAATGDEIMTLRGHSSGVWSVVFGTDGRRVVSGSSDNTINVWDVTIDRERKRLLGHHGGRGDIYSITFSPDGKRLVSCGGKTVKVWDMASGSELMTLRGHRSTVICVGFSPDGKHIASSNMDGTVNVHDAQTGATVTTLRGPELWVRSIAFSPDSKHIVFGGDDNTIKVWDVATGMEVMTLRGHKDVVLSVAFSPDGKYIISGSGDGTIKVWDAATGNELMTLRGHKDAVSSVSVSPDGKCIVSSGGSDNMIKVWDAVSGNEMMELTGHSGWVRSIAFSPDSKRIVSGGVDATVRVWDAETGAELIRLHAGEAVASVAFSPDGKVIAAATHFGNGIVVWDSIAPTGGYEPRKNGEAARRLVDELYEEYGFYHEVIDKLQADKTLAEPVRKVALQIANSRRWEDSEKLKKQSSESAGPEEAAAQ